VRPISGGITAERDRSAVTEAMVDRQAEACKALGIKVRQGLSDHFFEKYFEIDRPVIRRNPPKSDHRIFKK
jgi:hypothetical protein